jgi:hypothetical protein
MIKTVAVTIIPTVKIISLLVAKMVDAPVINDFKIF